MWATLICLWLSLVHSLKAAVPTLISCAFPGGPHTAVVLYLPHVCGLPWKEGPPKVRPHPALSLDSGAHWAAAHGDLSINRCPLKAGGLAPSSHPVVLWGDKTVPPSPGAVGRQGRNPAGLQDQCLLGEGPLRQGPGALLGLPLWGALSPTSPATAPAPCCRMECQEGWDIARGLAGRQAGGRMALALTPASSPTTPTGI